MTDANGEAVRAFMAQIGDLGTAKLGKFVLSMLDSTEWQDFTYEPHGRFVFLPGEYDYFLTQRGVTRDDVMNGVPDIASKALLDAAMDECRTGEQGYRRTAEEARAANPAIPGRPIMPFGYTDAQARSAGTKRRPAMGARARKYRRDGTSKFDSDELPPLKRILRLLPSLDLSELATVALHDLNQIEGRYGDSGIPLDLAELFGKWATKRGYRAAESPGARGKTHDPFADERTRKLLTLALRASTEAEAVAAFTKAWRRNRAPEGGDGGEPDESALPVPAERDEST